MTKRRAKRQFDKRSRGNAGTRGVPPTGKRSRTRLGHYNSTVSAGDMVVKPGRPTGLVVAHLIAVVLFVGSLWVLYSLFSNPRFQVLDVAVQGNRLIEEAEIREAAGIEGSSIFRVRPDAVAERLTQTFGCIDRVAVTTRLPNHVSIVVHELEDTVVWESGGTYWWLDADGRVLGTLDDPRDLVVVRDVAGFESEPEDQIIGPPWQLLRDMTHALPDVRAYDYTREEGLILYVTDGMWPVYLGHDGKAQDKVALMGALVDRLTQQGLDVQYIDMRNERRAAYKQR
jgi:cell division septal protein FtsQ